VVGVGDIESEGCEGYVLEWLDVPEDREGEQEKESRKRS
jgi:hypothetical protein